MRYNRLIIYLSILISVFLAGSNYTLAEQPTGEEKIIENVGRLANGEILYSDIKTYLAPGHYYLLSSIRGTAIEESFDLLIIVVTVMLLSFLFISTYKDPSKIPDKSFIFSDLLIVIVVATVIKVYFTLSSSLIVAYMIVFLNSLIIYKYYETKKLHFLVIAGMMLGLAGVFRHDVVSYLYGAEFWGIFFFGMKFFADKNSHWFKKTLIGLKYGFIFTGGILLIMLPAFFVLLTNTSSQELYYQLIKFPAFEFKDIYYLPFPNPFAMNKFTDILNAVWFYIPLIIFAITAFKLYFGSKKKILTSDDIKFWKVIFLFNLGINSYNQAMIVSDTYHLLPALTVASLLFYFVIDKFKYKLPIVALYSLILVFV